MNSQPAGGSAGEETGDSNRRLGVIHAAYTFIFVSWLISIFGRWDPALVLDLENIPQQPRRMLEFFHIILTCSFAAHLIRVYIGAWLFDHSPILCAKYLTPLSRPRRFSEWLFRLTTFLSLLVAGGELNEAIKFDYPVTADLFVFEIKFQDPVILGMFGIYLSLVGWHLTVLQGRYKVLKGKELAKSPEGWWFHNSALGLGASLIMWNLPRGILPYVYIFFTVVFLICLIFGWILMRKEKEHTEALEEEIRTQFMYFNHVGKLGSFFIGVLALLILFLELAFLLNLWSFR